MVDIQLSLPPKPLKHQIIGKRTGELFHANGTSVSSSTISDLYEIWHDHTGTKGKRIINSKNYQGATLLKISIIVGIHNLAYCIYI